MMLVEALNALADALEDSIIRLDEKGRAYYMDEVEEKRWVLGDGGKGGNCDECEEAAEEGDKEDGWVDMDFTYGMFDAPVDGPPGHPNDTCELEYRTRRVRVYS